MKGVRKFKDGNTIRSPETELERYLESRMCAELDAKPDKVKRTRRPVERA